jgi:predicted permease
LPALIFVEVSKISLSEALDFKMLGFVIAGILVTFIFAWIISLLFIDNGKDRGAFIQGSFRGNYAIVGLALISNIFGTENLGKASLLLAFVIPLYNVLSVIALTVTIRKERRLNISKTFFEIIRNPLIIAVIIALPFSYYRWELPDIIATTVNYLAALSLPLALLGIGGFMNFKDIRKASSAAVISAFLKLILFPFASCFLAYKLSFRNGDIGIIFILFGCPAAIASFIMAEAMGSNGKLAGKIVLISTLFSVITLTIGLFILKQNGLL